MAKITVYQTGERYFQGDSISIGIHEGAIEREIDLGKATPEEATSLAMNPYNDVLIDEVVKR
jgi:hypothetical protein